MAKGTSVELNIHMAVPLDENSGVMTSMVTAHRDRPRSNNTRCPLFFSLADTTSTWRAHRIRRHQCLPPPSLRCASRKKKRTRRFSTLPSFQLTLSCSISRSTCRVSACGRGGERFSAPGRARFQDGVKQPLWLGSGPQCNIKSSHLKSDMTTASPGPE